MAGNPDTDIDQGDDILSTPYGPGGGPAQQDNVDLNPEQDDLSGGGGYGGALPALRPTAPGVYAPGGAPSAPVPTVGRGTGRRGFSGRGFTPDEGGEVSFAAPPSAGAASDEADWTDYAKNAWNSVVATKASLAGVAEYVSREISGDSDLSQWLKSSKDDAVQGIQDRIASMSPASQETLRAKLVSGGETDGQGNRIPTVGEVGWTRWAAMTISGFIPDALMMFIPGTLAAKGALKTLELAGAATRVTAEAAEAAGGGLRAGQLSQLGERAATAGHMTGSAAYFGATGAGDAYNTVAEGLGHASENEMQNVPGYAELRRQGMSHDQAKQQLLPGIASFYVAAGAAVGAATGAGLGPLSRGAGGAAIASGRGVLPFLGRRAIGAAEGGALMGAQGAGDEAINQALRIQLGQQQTYDMGQIGRAGAAGALGGAALGGALGARREPAGQQEALQRAQAYQNAPMAVPDRAGGARYTVPRPPEPLGPEAPYSGPPTPPSGPTGTPGESPPVGGARIFRTPPAMASPAGEPVDIPGYSPPAGGGATQPVEQAPPITTVGTGAPRPSAGPAPQTAPVGERGTAPGTAPAPLPSVGSLPAAGQVGPRPSAGMAKADMIDGLASRFGVKMSARASQADVATRYDREMAREPAATPTPTPAAAAAETKPEALATEPAVAETPVAGAAKPTTGLEQLGGAAKAIGDNLRDMLWTKHQAGETTEAGQPSNILRASRALAEQGAITDRASFDRFVNDFSRARGEITTQADFQKFLGDWAQRNAPAEAPAPPVEKAVEAPKVEAKPEPITEETLKARELALEQLADARATVKPLPKGTPVAAAVERAWQQLQAQIGESGGTREHIMRLLRDFVQKQEGEADNAPAVKGRRQVAAAMFSRIAERGRARVEEVRARNEREQELHEVVAEETAPRATAREPTSPELIERQATGKGEGESAGQTMGLEAGRKKPLAKDTTDYERIAKDKLFRIEDGEIPLEKAVADYGTQNTGKGRKRRPGFEDLPKALRTLYERGADPDKESARIVQEMRAANDSKLVPYQKKALLERLGRELDRVTDPEKREAFRRLVERAEDPVKAAADDEAARRSPLEHAPTSTGIDPRSSRAVQMTTDARMSVPLAHMMRTSEAYGADVTDRDVAQMVMRDPLVANERPDLKALATQLHKLARGVPVLTPRQAYERTFMGSRQLERYESGTGAYGHYESDPAIEHIVVNIHGEHEHGTYLETALHEMAHSAYHHYIEYMRRFDPDHRDLQALHAMSDELKLQLNAAIRSGEVTRGRAADSLLYALSNEDELHTMLLTNADVQAFAASRQASTVFRTRMTQLGYAPREKGRSIWSHFVDMVRKGLGLRTPTSASEYTLLDHILRPVTDIASRAAKYNERYLPRDPELRAQAEPIEHATTLAFGPGARELANRALDRVDPRGIGDRARRWLLQGATSDGLVARYAQHLPGLAAWQRANEGIYYEGKQFSDKYADRAQDVVKRITRADNRDALQNLMNDATMAEVRLGAGADNSHLTTPAQLDRLATLQRHYNALTAHDRETYQTYQQLSGEQYHDIRQAQLRSMINTFVPDMSEPDQQAFLRAARSAEGLDRYVENVDAAQRPIARAIASFHKLGFVQGDYFPLRRFGNYVVRYGDPDVPENYGVEFFERRSQAQARVKELRDQGTERVLPVALKESSLNEIAPPNAMVDELLHRLGQRGATAGTQEMVRGQLNQILLAHQTRSERSRLAQSYRRRGVRGASLDQARAAAHDFVANSQMIGHALWGPARAKALADIAADVREHEVGTRTGLDPVVARSVLNEVSLRSSSVTDADNSLHELGRKANIWNYALSLMSPSHMLTSSMEAHTNSLALLGARYGYGATMVQLAKALRHAAPILGKGATNTVRAVRGQLQATDWNLAHVVRDRMIAQGANASHMTRLFDALERAGLIDHTVMTDLRSQALAKGITGGRTNAVWNGFMNMNAASAHAVDVMNKSAIARAAFDLEMGGSRKGSQDVNRAIEAAVEFARKAMPNYNTPNKARIATYRGALGQLGAPLMQFKNYGLHMYTIMANLAHEMATGENKAEAAKAFAGLIATHSLMAGALTSIADPLRYIGGAYDWATGAKRPVDRAAAIQGFLSDVMGPRLADLVTGGLPHMMGYGVDVSHRTGLNNLLEIPEMKTFNSAGAKDVLFGLMTGASGENLSNVFNGVSSLMQGDIGDVFKQAMPRPVRDIIKGVRLATKGITDTKGATILPAEKLTKGDVAAQMLGFQPARVANFHQAHNAVIEARQETADERARLEQRWLAADPAERANVQQEIKLFNQDPRHHGSPITGSQLLQQQHAAKRAAREEFGLRLGRRAQSTLERAGRFVLP